ncbi:conidial pigment biosynthesis oxidase arb2 brown2 like protein [Zymoseptoria brevis]|uniref:Conidial pigment biosynthesis oxidase arb2 brown2 like protein n=1 Tax=Zymoseptoria brevis TaxID=1047168 RepID=A0A0F4GWZ6_9PEZI|nr:conidial pigment biosynthesis oxidase arb2 brown2 like protein [Zymoseptoria brevis]
MSFVDMFTNQKKGEYVLVEEKLPASVHKRSSKSIVAAFVVFAACAVLSIGSGFRKWYPTDIATDWPLKASRQGQRVDYNLTLSQSWRNPDGGHWRPLFVGNSESPFATINCNEGDTLHIHIQNDLGFPTQLHWVGVNHGSATWNDGSAGVTAYPILPRANWTSVIRTEGQWGLKWYLDHVSTPSVDGNYGTIWIRPAADRMRPYHLISSCKHEQQAMLDAEGKPAHVVMYNYQHREMPGLLAQLQGEGYDPYCFQSVLINGKGRVHCRPAEVTALNGKSIDSHGCVYQPSGAIGYGQCEPSNGDYEIIETENRRWMMMNFVNPGLEHPWRVSIDNHKMWIIANDGGFVQPQEVDIIQVTNAERVTVMVRLDQEAADYPIRFHALSDLQSLQGYAILRYPHRRIGQRLGEPYPEPKQENSIMALSGSPIGKAVLEDKSTLHPYPAQQPPEHADITLRFKATGAPDPYNPYITNCSLNGTSWQIFRGLMHPMYLDPNQALPDAPDPAVRNLPLGSVVDIVLENDLPVDLPMYKHNKALFLLGSGEGKFGEADVAAAASKGSKSFNLKNPPLGSVHELPASGWMALRWKITEPAATMFHVFRVRYFVLGMQVPLFEGDDYLPEVPERVKNMPHVELEIPEHMGIFD